MGTQEEYCAIDSGHTMCVHTVRHTSTAPGHLLTLQGPSDACAAKTVERDLTEAAKQGLVDKHNELRRKVARGEETSGPQPAASNMRKLVWNDELAVIAQRWADQCIFDHDTARQKADGTWVGQNLYIRGSNNLKDKETVNTFESLIRDDGTLCSS